MLQTSWPWGRSPYLLFQCLVSFFRKCSISSVVLLVLPVLTFLTVSQQTGGWDPSLGPSFPSRVLGVGFLSVLSHCVLWRLTGPQGLICVALEMWVMLVVCGEAWHPSSPRQDRNSASPGMPAPASGRGCLFSWRSRPRRLGKTIRVPQWCQSWLHWVRKGGQQRSYWLFSLEMVKQRCSWLWPSSPVAVSTAQIGPWCMGFQWVFVVGSCQWVGWAFII